MSGKTIREKGAMGRLVSMPVLFAGLIVAGCAILQKPPDDPLEEVHELYDDPLLGHEFAT